MHSTWLQVIIVRFFNREIPRIPRIPQVRTFCDEQTWNPESSTARSLTYLSKPHRSRRLCKMHFLVIEQFQSVSFRRLPSFPTRLKTLIYCLTVVGELKKRLFLSRDCECKQKSEIEVILGSFSVRSSSLLTFKVRCFVEETERPSDGLQETLLCCFNWGFSRQIHQKWARSIVLSVRPTPLSSVIMRKNLVEDAAQSVYYLGIIFNLIVSALGRLITCLFGQNMR